MGNVQLDRIEKKIDNIQLSLENQRPAVNAMSDHISLVESYVNIMPSARVLQNVMQRCIVTPLKYVFVPSLKNKSD
tara:strand:+ start:263 stop:490 length:228 start_codon:yes stop_codon:yes gene_type:complete